MGAGVSTFTYFLFMFYLVALSSDTECRWGMEGIGILSNDEMMARKNETPGETPFSVPFYRTDVMIDLYSDKGRRITFGFYVKPTASPLQTQTD